MTNRDALRADFINRCGWDDAEVEALPFDASLRRYYRLRRGTATTMIMDAPPEKGEAVAPFIRIDEHLLRLGLSAPVIHERDIEHGFLRLEDFGEDTFVKLLAEGHDETQLYELAVDTIIALQTAPDVMDIDVTNYLPRFVPDLEWLLQWWVPERIGRPATEECRMRFYQAWEEVLSRMPPPTITLMQRDYHVPNLILLPGREGHKACGVLDFQSAEFAPRPYDLMCLLEDARRDVSTALREAMLARYSAALPIDDSFRAWYAAIAVQRHMRVLGNFSRQALQNKNFSYQVHIPRVQGYLDKSLEAPQLAPVRAWIDRWVGRLTG